MSGMTCDQIRAVALDPGTGSRDWARRPDAAAHVRQCAECQDWLDAFTAGEQAWASESEAAFAAKIVAMTAGVEAVVRDLPLLAELDPGPGFTERVLMATARKPAPQGWRARAAGAWWALVRRPRFAWEAAYLATVCWVLVFGNPVGAIEWSTSSLGAVARERLGPPVKEFRADLETWRGTLAPAPSAAQDAPAGAQADPVPPVVRAWQAATDWLSGLAASAADVFARAWERVAEWLGRLAGQPPAPATELPADTVRSPQ